MCTIEGIDCRSQFDYMLPIRFQNSLHGIIGLLFDDFICHKSDGLQSQMDDDNILLYTVSPHYRRLLHPSDVGIDNSLKDD